MIIDPDTLDPQSCYKLLIGSVVPRPIAWISTVSQEGVRNLAPFSFFTVASRQPPFPEYKIPVNAPVTLKPSSVGVTSSLSIR